MSGIVNPVIGEGSVPLAATVVDVDSATVSFGGEFALRPTSFTLKQGEAVMVRGASGAGKSTLLRVVARLLKPTSGTTSLWPAEPDSLGKRRIGLTLDEPRLWPWMKATDTVVCLAGLNGVKVSRAEVKKLLAELNLADAAGTKASDLSQGMARRVQLAGALVVGLDLLLLDEPTASLDTENRERVWCCLERRRLMGIPIVVASHDDSWQGHLSANQVIELGDE
jgi:ABC-2 type transport system ATP-binding protein